MTEYVGSAYIAHYLGCTNPAVSNWLARGVLPFELMPVAWVRHPDKGNQPLWRHTQLPLFKEWYNDPKKTGRRY
jgi:hypothetical protein